MRCECRTESDVQSPHSPGLVRNEEQIVYALVSPLTGSFKDVSQSQLKAGTVSVCRADHCAGRVAKRHVVDVLLEKDSTRSDDGYLYATCADIRDLRLGESDVGAFCVVDDGLPHYPAHAHLGYSQPADDKLRNHRAAARGNLLKLLNENGVQTLWSGFPFKEIAA